MSDPSSREEPGFPAEPGSPSASGGPSAGGSARGLRLTLAGTLANALLAAVKIATGVVGNSYALVADGIESVIDIFSSLVVWGSLKIATIPPDEKHPFGHGKAEPLGALVVSIALLAAAVGIASQSIRGILGPRDEPPEAYTLFVLIGVVVTKEVLFRVLTRTGTDLGSQAMLSDAWHHRSDALTSAAAFLGISIALAAGEGYESADEWAALFACAVILVNGVRLFRAALDEVMDAAPSEEIETRVRNLASSVAGVRGLDKCRVRKSGLHIFIELHVIVAGDLTVSRGHEIGHDVKDALLASELPVADVAVHVEPG